jgi:tRNA(Ile)-lysidine synthase
MARSDVTAASADEVTLRTAVRRSIEFGPVVHRLIVAFSGGPDSLALAAAAAWVRDHDGPQVTAVIVDHQAQTNSAKVAQQAADVCARLAVPAEIRRVVVQGAGGFEAAARRVRYQALREAADEYKADAVLLGHTRDDQAETVLLRLLRGSGARSLAAMRPVDGLWRRPFLDVPRSTVHRVADAVAARMGVSVWRDPQNVDPAFARVRVRELLGTWPDGAAASYGLARSAALLADDADALDAQATHHMETCVDGTDVVIETLAELPRALRTRILRRWLVAAGSPAGDLDFDHVRAVDALVSSWHGQGEISVPGPLYVHRECGRLRVSRAPKE